MTAIPHAAKYSPSVPVVHGRKVNKVNIELLNAEFDTRLHARMNKARDEDAWGEILGIMINAQRNDNLRAGVRDRFFADCPFEKMVHALRVRTGIQPRRAKNSPSPLGNKTPADARQRAERKRAERRERDARACPKFANGHGKKPRD